MNLRRAATVGTLQPPRFSGLFGFLGFMLALSGIALGRLLWWTWKATWWLIFLVVAGVVAVTLATVAGISTWAVVRAHRRPVEPVRVPVAIDATSRSIPPPPPRVQSPWPPPQTGV